MSRDKKLIIALIILTIIMFLWVRTLQFLTGLNS